MKSAVVCTSRTFGGAEKYLQELYGAAQDLGVSTTLYGSLPGWTHASIDLGLRGKWDRSYLWRGPLLIPVEYLKLGRGIRDASSSSSVFHMQFKREQVLATARAAKYGPVIWTEHGPLPKWFAPLRERYRAAARQVSTIVCVSAAVGEAISQVVGDRVDLVVIENGVDTRHFTPASPDDRRHAQSVLGLDSNRPVALVVSRLIGWKRVDRAIEAARLRPDIQMLVAGDGPDGDRLRAGAPSNVCFLGEVGDVRPLYAAATCFVHLSEPAKEGMPLVLLEAASAGLPAIAVGGGALDGFLKGSGGLLTDGSPIEVVSAIDILSPNDAPRKWAEARSIESCAAKHVDVFRRASSG